MALTIAPLEREFHFNGTILPDINPSLTVAQVQDTHAATYPELANAKTRIETKGSKQIITFTVAAGTKG